MSAFDTNAIFNKSKVFIGRALDCDDAGDEITFHLWAALSLELLGKSALANVHPALIADPTDVGSIFAACGKPISTHRKSILAKTLFDRLTHLSKRFLAEEKTFCLEMTHRRNAELHSGELPLVGLTRNSWVPKFWRVAEIILEMQGKTLSDWLGKQRADAAADEMRRAELTSRIELLIKVHTDKFQKAYPDQESKRIARTEAEAKIYTAHTLFQSSESESISPVTCPSCKSLAALGGTEWFSESTGDYSEDEPWMELVEVTYTTLAFQCPQCGLRLNGREELDAAGFPDEFVDIETREMEVEPDYGND